MAKVKITTEREAFAGYRYGAKLRNIWFDLTFHEFTVLSKQECFYCGVTPETSRRAINLNTRKLEVVSRNGIDRLDNNQGYILENCVPCCRWCNTMKSNMTLEEFFKRISRIYHIHIKEVTV